MSSWKKKTKSHAARTVFLALIVKCTFVMTPGGEDWELQHQ